MSYFFLLIVVFIMFFQPTAVFPELVHYQPLRNTAVIAFILYLISRKNISSPFFSIWGNRFFSLFVLMQILSASALWLRGGLDIFIEWMKIGIVYFLIFKLGTSEKRITWLAAAIVSGITYLSYYSVTSYFSMYQPGLRAWGYGWYEAANDISLAMVIAIPLSFLVSESSRGIIRKLFLFFPVLFGFNILLTGSRNGLLGLAGVGFLSIVS